MGNIFLLTRALVTGRVPKIFIITIVHITETLDISTFSKKFQLDLNYIISKTCNARKNWLVRNTV